MARRPAYGERGLVPPPDFFPPEERVFLTELARYLGVSSRKIAKWARKEGVLHRARDFYRGTEALWLSPHAAMRAIVLIRSEQGAAVLNERGPEARKERKALKNRALDADRRVRASRERAAERLRRDLCIAFPGADTEDESRGDGRNVSPPQQDEAESLETAVVSPSGLFSSERGCDSDAS